MSNSELIVDSVLSDPAGMSILGASRIAMTDGTIAAIEAGDGPAQGTILLPAFANAHDHGRGLRTLAFGAVDDALECWISTLSREPKLPAYHRAAVAFARMAEGGIAATNHSHGTQNEGGIVEEAEAVSRAARDVGIRVAFAAPFMDRNLLAYGDQRVFIGAADPSIRERLQARLGPAKPVERFLAEVDEIAAFEHETFTVQYCPVAPQWVSEPALAAIAEASALKNRRVHMHLLETRAQREWADHAYPGGLVQFMDSIGLLSPRLSVAHGVYLNPDECDLLARRGVIVSVNTSSNFRLRSGIAPVGQFLKSGLRFGAGLDAQPTDDDDDMLREMRLIWLNHRGFGMNDVLSAERLFEAVMIDGRQAILGRNDGGRVAVGAPADLLVLDYAAMARDILAESENPLTVLLTRATRKHISRLIVAGRTVVQDGRCVSVDRAGLESELIDAARAAWKAAPPDDNYTSRYKQAVRHYYGCQCHMGQALTAI